MVQVKYHTGNLLRNDVQPFCSITLFYCVCLITRWALSSAILCLSTHCTVVIYKSEWVTVALHSTCFGGLFKYPPKWSTYSTVWLLYGWCHKKLLPPQCTFCVHCITMHQFTVSLYSMPHTWGACVFRCNLPPAFLEECLVSFTCHCGNTGVEQIPKHESAQKVVPGVKMLLPGINPVTFQPWFWHFITELSTLM